MVRPRAAPRLNPLTQVEQGKPRQLARVLEGDKRDREVLNRKAGRVEDRDLLVSVPALGSAGEDGT